VTNQGSEIRVKETIETREFAKGLIIGVATALAIGGLIALLTTKCKSSREGMRARKRLQSYDQDEQAIGEVPDEFEEHGSNGGIVETIRSVNDALDTGRQAMETLKNVIENIRGN
jgi:hypothetical protein